MTSATAGQISDICEEINSNIASIQDRMGVIQSAARENQEGVDEIVMKVERTNTTAEKLQNVSRTNRNNARGISSVVERFT